MLEYLLLRPRDMDLFDAGADSQLAVHRRRRGARLRRQPGRRGRDAAAPAARPGRRRVDGCPVHRDISATVGRRRDPRAVIELRRATCSASRSSGMADDADRQDLVTATRLSQRPTAPCWGPLPAATTSILPPEAPERWPRRPCHGWSGIDGRPTRSARKRRLAAPRSPGWPRARGRRRSSPTALGDVDAARAHRPGRLAGLASPRLRAVARCLVSALPPVRAGHRRRLHLPGRHRAAPHVQLTRHEECADCEARGLRARRVQPLRRGAHRSARRLPTAPAPAPSRAARGAAGIRGSVLERGRHRCRRRGRRDALPRGCEPATRAAAACCARLRGAASPPSTVRPARPEGTCPWRPNASRQPRWTPGRVAGLPGVRRPRGDG